MASNVTDEARREEILKRALMGLQEDIDDLRAELLDALPDYEQRLRQHTSELPGWLKLAPARIRKLFHFSDDSVAPDGLLGPRSIALGAGRVETFVERWFRDEAGERAALSDEARGALVEDYEALCSYLDELDAEVRRVADTARRTLDEWLDAVLTELDARRETDVEALEELVREGEVGRGRNARQEIADLWEEQRNQAAELQDQWSLITALVDEGLETSARGFAELWAMVERAHQGLTGAYAGLADEIDSPQNETMRLSAEETAALDEPPMKTVPDQAPPSAGDVDDAGDTIPDDGFVHGIVPLEEPTSEPEMGALESSSVSDYSEPHLVEASSVSSLSQRGTTQRLYTRSDRREGEEDGREDASAKPPPSQEPAAVDDASRSQTAPAPADGPGPEAPPADSAEAVVSECFRIRAGYEPVGTAEVAAVLGPPVTYLLAMGALCAAHLLGAGVTENPFVRWSWMPASLAVALGWLFLVPFALRWRIRWSDMRPTVLRSTDVRQTEELVIDAEAMSIGPKRWRYDQLQAPRLRRWDSPADDLCGWVLFFDPPSDPTIYLVAAEPDRGKWQNSPVELVDVPYEAWQLDAGDFQTARERLV